jgi:hypothetical protein
LVLVCLRGFFFQSDRELDFSLHVVNAVYQHTDFISDGVSLLAARADDLAGMVTAEN